MSYNIKLVYKEDIRIGDIIMCNDGNMRTVCKNNITHDGFMGVCIFGDSYQLGYNKVKKVVDLKF